MGKRFKKDISHSQKQRNPRNKKNKTVLVFDEEAREQYLTGFSKRKAERKKVAHEREIEKLREEKRQIKKKRREALASQAAQRDAAEIESLVETKTFDLDTHTVSITDVSEVDYVGKSGLHLGNNLGESEEQEEAAETEEVRAENSDDEEKEETPSKPVLSKKKLKHLGNEKVWKPDWKLHKNYSHIMNHKNKRLNREANRRKERKRLLKKKPRNKPH